MMLILFQSKKFFKMGQLMGMSISQQGSGFPFLSWTAFNYLCGDSTMDLEVAIEDIPLTNARNFLEEVSSYIQWTFYLWHNLWAFYF